MSTIWGTFSHIFSGHNSQEQLFRNMDANLDRMNHIPTVDPKYHEWLEKEQKIIEERLAYLRQQGGSLVDKTVPLEVHTGVTQATQDIAQTNLPASISGNPAGVPPISKVPEKLAGNSLFNAGLSFLSVATAASVVKGFFAFIPFFVGSIVYSEEKNLQSIHVNISASSKPKIYEVGIGKKNRFVKIALEVEAGKPIRYLREKEIHRISNYVPKIFSSENFFSKIPFLNSLRWKRQEHHALVTIRVDDPGNPSLLHGPTTCLAPLSKNEGFMVVHRDPSLVENPLQDFSIYDRVLPAESSKYTRLNSFTVEVKDPISSGEPHRTATYPLLFHKKSNESNDYYLRVTQYH